MLFPTIAFAAFFLAVYSLSYPLAKRNNLRKVFLLGASYFFYATWDPQFLALLIGCTLANYGLGWAIGKWRAREKLAHSILITGITLNLLVLAVFKYFNFFTSSLMNFFGSFGIRADLPLVELAIPLGISFFTFQGISYIVDVYTGKLPAERHPLNVLFFISFFPHLVSGPIVRASDFIPQLHQPVNPDRVDLSRPIVLLSFGLFKKLVLANYLSTSLVDPVFDSPSSFSMLDVLLATYGYAIQIYCDFSAYSDMAIALAALLGYEFPKNFDQPYRSQSLKEFWRRWHISLSNWLRDYLFIPLGGSRGSDLKTYRNLMITMLLGGIWHGAAWTFVFWGALHGAGLALERWRTQRHAATCQCTPQQSWATFRTFHFVCFAWIFFRCESLDKAGAFFSAFTHFLTPIQKVNPFTVSLVAVGAALHFLPSRLHLKLPEWLGKTPAPVLGLCFGLVLMAIAAVTPDEVAPFIYFRF